MIFTCLYVMDFSKGNLMESALRWRHERDGVANHLEFLLCANDVACIEAK